MMGLALWHFTIFLPDRFWAGIVGAFLGSVIGGVLFGVLIHGFTVPGESATNVGTTLEAIPGTLIGLGIVFALGVRDERREAALLTE
jgi:ABC-type Fe3+ transport system permease subunit